MNALHLLPGGFWLPLFWLLLACRAEATTLEALEFAELPEAGLEVRLTFDARAPNPSGYFTLQPPRLVLDFPGVKSALAARHQAPGTAIRLTLVETPELLRLVLVAPGRIRHRTSSFGNTLSLRISPEGDGDAKNPPAPAPDPRFTGEKLSLNFQDLEVRAALQLLADFAGQDLVAGDSVTGSITLQLNDLPWDQVLDIILRTRGLGKRQEDGVLIVAPAEELAEQDRLRLLNRQQLAELAPLTTSFIEVHYANAKELLSLFESAKAGQGLLSPRGRALVDPRTNSIILTDTAEGIAAFRAILARLDVPVRQVLIEARIVSASNNAGEQLGVSWGGHAQRLRKDGGGLFLGGSRATLRELAQAAGSGNVAGDDQLVVDLGLDSRDATSFAIGLLTDSSLLELEINALASEGKAEVIARPKVITSDKTEARIASGLQIPFEQSTEGGGTSIAFQEATLSLQVTPQITPDDRIIMRLDISQDTLGVNTAAGPAINTNQIYTQVLVDDGETIVLGGIFTTNRSETLTRTPLLGDVPLLGRLFRRTTRSDSKEELLIFITPRLLNDDPPGP